MTNINFDKNSSLGNIGGSKDITVGDAVRYIHQKSWLGKTVQKVWVFITGKGRINEKKIKEKFAEISSLELLKVISDLLQKNIQPSNSTLITKINDISTNILNPRKALLQDQKETQELIDNLNNSIAQIDEVLEKFPATYRQTLKKEYKSTLDLISTYSYITIHSEKIDREVLKSHIASAKELLQKIIDRKPVLEENQAPPNKPVSQGRKIRIRRGSPNQQPQTKQQLVSDTSSERTNTDYHQELDLDSDDDSDNSTYTDSDSNESKKTS